MNDIGEVIAVLKKSAYRWTSDPEELKEVQIYNNCIDFLIDLLRVIAFLKWIWR